MHEINTNMTATQMVAAINENFGSSAEELVNKPLLSNYIEPSIKVLAIGNSYTYWSLLAFGAVAELTGKDSSKYSLNTVASSGASLSELCDRFYSAGTTAFYKTYGSALGVSSGSTFKNAISKDWDAIVFQHVHTEVTDYATYRHYLDALINAAKRYCTNKAVQVGFHMIWDWHHYTDNKDRPAIVANAKKVFEDCDIDFIIPAGTAFENAWAAGRLQSQSTHFDNTFHAISAETQFLASATWYQALYKALLGKDIVTDMTAELTDPVTWVGSQNAEMSLSAETCKIAAKCAKAAVEDMWNVTTIE